MPKPKKWINYSGMPADTTPVDRLEPTSATTQHLGPAPVERIHRRHKPRRVQLTNGNPVRPFPPLLN